MIRDDVWAFVGFAAFALLLLGVTAVWAAESEPKLPPNVTCDMIRSKYEEYRMTYPRLILWIKATEWARGQGYSWGQIREARKCLK
jgi:hypothetical protein